MYVGGGITNKIITLNVIPVMCHGNYVRNPGYIKRWCLADTRGQRNHTEIWYYSEVAGYKIP
jgi:hypothetical protein